MRRTVRGSLATGGVPVDPQMRHRVPRRPELAVLCDVSGSVAHFAGFALMLVFALREEFRTVRAFTFVDSTVEVTEHFRPGADPAEVMTRVAASAEQAAIWGRTNYGRAFNTFAERYPDAVGPRTSLIVLGDARSNHSDLAEPVLAELCETARHAWWLNPETPRQWGVGDSAATTYAEIMPMVECRTLAQLSAFVRRLA